MSTTHTPPPAAAQQPPASTNPSHTTRSTPNVGPSNTWKYFLYVFIFLIFTVGLTILNNKNWGTEKGEEPDLSNYDFGEIMSLQVKPHQKTKVLLAYSDFIMYASDEITTLNDKGIKRNVLGFKFTSGPDATPTTYYFFRNGTEKAITVRLARFRNEKELNQIKKKF